MPDLVPTPNTGSWSGTAPVPVAGLPGRKHGRKGKRVSGNPAKRNRDNAAEAAVRAFAAWLAEQDQIAGPTVADEIAQFGALLKLGRKLGLNPLTASGLTDLVDELMAVGDGEDDVDGDVSDFVEQGLVTLGDYACFRVEADPDDPAWDEALSVVDDAIEELGPFTAVLHAAQESAETIDPEERRAVCASTRLVSAVRPLLAWLGNGRATTPAGGVRRADIAEVSALLDIAAVGVNKRAPYVPEGPTLFDMDGTAAATPVTQALSVNDVPLVAAWWDALGLTGVIERDGSRFRPGLVAAAWLAELEPPLELAEQVLGLTLADVISGGYQSGAESAFLLAYLIARLTPALVPDGEMFEVEGPEPEPQYAGRVDAVLRLLAHGGLVELGEDGVSVHPALRGVVARGIYVAATVADIPEPDRGR